MPELTYTNRILNMPWVLNMSKFWIWQGSQYASVTQRSEYARIWLDRVLTISLVLNMLEFWIWQGSEYASVTQYSKYVTIWLNMSEKDVNIPEYTWIYKNRQGSEYVSYNMYGKATLQVNEYLRVCVYFLSQ